MKLFILETKLCLIMGGFSSLLSMWIDLLSAICVTSAFRTRCEQDLMLYPNTHFFNSTVWWLWFTSPLPDHSGWPPVYTCQNAHVCGNPIHLDSLWSESLVSEFREKSSTLQHPLLQQLYSDFWQFEWTRRALIGSVWSVKDMNKPIKGLDDWSRLICSIWLVKVIN